MTDQQNGSDSVETAEVDRTTQTGSEALEGAAEGQEDTFPRSYVEELRTEAKEAREKAQRTDWLLTEAKRLALREGTRGVLTDPEALSWSDEWLTGNRIDHDAIRAAAEALAAEKPWLTRPRGDVGQGAHSESQGLPSLSALLRG